ncbi:MAG TPA: low affinity iron permease family protein [Phenylobacterium sp.]
MDRLFAQFANATARISGSPKVFLLCMLVVLVWAASGPMFHFSETWQLVINTGTTIVTFLMVFLIQNTQNRDGMALQTKLDELIRTSDADNIFMGIEKLTDKELDALHAECERAAKKAEVLLRRADAERETRRSKIASAAKARTGAKAASARKPEPVKKAS